MSCLRMLKPHSFFSGTGIQLAVSDTDTAPEGLFFELVKPPHHGIVLKYSAGVQELMGAGELSRRGVSLSLVVARGTWHLACGTWLVVACGRSYLKSYSAVA